MGDERDAIDFMYRDLRARLKYHHLENPISYASAIGVLRLLSAELEREALEVNLRHDDGSLRERALKGWE
jgi:hypothetical protein